MAAFSGTAGSVVLVGTAGTVVTGMSEWNLNVTSDVVETTAFGDGWKSFLSSIKGATGSFSGNRDNTAAQSTLVTQMLAGSVVALKLHAGATNYWNIGSAYITDMSPSISNDGKGEISFSFTANGAVTYV